ncbi:hypothetical protein Novomoskovsk_3 [Bacillus phage Novomoskovsk]|uniref:Uncharacterized protein n=1 Tax=Bacillus phage Novomoskovsk TaxID=2736258 RepID=A0A6M9Z5E2_9CAUD|nr:hypothetical protein Novomoskovsk_3 [Bacillus phage Novomoskovsk]
MDKLADITGAMIMGAIFTLCLCTSLVFIVGTARWIRSSKKPPCQHDLMVCDYKRTYDDDFIVGHQYLAACKKCGKTNWVSANYLNEMSNLGLYDKEEPK